MTPQEKYNNDPMYFAFVNNIVAFLGEYQMSSTEVRQATIFACTLHEQRRINPQLPLMDRGIEL